MIYSKFMSKPVNFLPFALFQFFILISYHLHLFTLSYSHPPTSPLPLPCLGWSRLWSSPGIVCTNGLWTVIVIILYFCIFLYFDMYFVCKMIDVSFIWWIGLPDKLIRVSSPILLALRWLIFKELYVWYNCCSAVNYCLCQ